MRVTRQVSVERCHFSLTRSLLGADAWGGGAGGIERNGVGASSLGPHEVLPQGLRGGLRFRLRRRDGLSIWGL